MNCCCSEGTEESTLVVQAAPPALEDSSVDAVPVDAAQSANDAGVEEEVAAVELQVAANDARTVRAAEGREAEGGQSPASSGRQAESGTPGTRPVLPLTFRPPGSARTYTALFETKPLGLDFDSNVKPVRITRAFGAAKALGIRENSELIAIDGIDVERMEFSRLLELLKVKIAPLWPDGLVISFRDLRGASRSIVFPTQPLDLEFYADKTPIKISRSFGIARTMGVELDWVIERVAGKSVEKMSFSEFLVCLQAKIGALPMSETPTAVQAPLGEGLPLVFRDPTGSRTYTANFHHKPLGMDFNSSVKPVKIQKVFGFAKALGVKENSELVSIAGINVESMAFDEMLELLKEKMEPLQSDGLVTVFIDREGTERAIIFPFRPLGMDFIHGDKPLRVSGVFGQAQKMGVENNWELRTIAGTDIQMMEFAQALELLQTKIRELPAKN